MNDRRGFTVWELLCVIGVIAMLFALLMPSLSRVKQISTRVVCGTNLKGLGTAMVVYGNDYEDRYPVLPGEGAWSRELGFDYSMEKPDFKEGGAEHGVGRTITASLYLLVREADVSPKSFVCSESAEEAFGGRYSYISESSDITEMWDFGDDPYKHVSYSMHNPYGEYPADGTRSAAFAVAGDMSPWFEDGNILGPGKDGESPQLLSFKKYMRSSFSSGGGGNYTSNSRNHSGVGQNVLFGDGHSSYEKGSDVGVKYDGIYTFWPGAGASDEDKRIGENPTGRGAENDAKDVSDSFLAI